MKEHKVKIAEHWPLILHARAGDTHRVPSDRRWLIMGMNAIPQVIDSENQIVRFKDLARNTSIEMPLNALMRSTILLDAIDEATDFRKLGDKLKSLISEIDSTYMETPNLWQSIIQQLSDVTLAWTELYRNLSMDFGSWGKNQILLLPTSEFSIIARDGIEFDIYITEIIDAGTYSLVDGKMVRE